jgi:DNA-binding NtrC family response regulator
MPEIAIIDDDLDFLKIFKDKLKFLDYECKIFSNPESAMKQIFDFDVVFLDYNLGRVNGKEILAKIKSKKKTIYVIMISGYIIDNVIKRNIYNALYSFHSKPIDFNIIKKELDELFRNQKI